MSNVFFELPQTCTVEAIAKKDGTSRSRRHMAGLNSRGGRRARSRPVTLAEGRRRALSGDMKVITISEKNVRRADAKHKTAKIDVWAPYCRSPTASRPAQFSVQGQYVVNHFRWLMERRARHRPKKVTIFPRDVGPGAGPSVLARRGRAPCNGVYLASVVPEEEVG
jgi:hypothetical protein